MEQEAENLLTQFAQLANKSTLHPLDWVRFHLFVIHVHLFGLKISDLEVRDRLERLGFTHQKASQLASFYFEAKSLLTLYDKQRGQARTEGAQ